MHRKRKCFTDECSVPVLFLPATGHNSSVKIRQYPLYDVRSFSLHSDSLLLSPEMMNKNLTRKNFFKAAGWILSLPVFYLFGIGIRTERKNRNSGQILLKGPFPDGITFFERFIMVKKGHQITLYENRCTHLGCKINKMEGGTLQCPCHGSMFDTSGQAVKGPAYKPLKKLRYILNHDELTVFLS